MLSKELRTAILALAGRGSGIRQIAKTVGVSRNTVRKRENITHTFLNFGSIV